MFSFFFFFYSANCQSPGDINHGLKFGNNYTHGKTVRYVCNPGYALEGEAELTCEDGRWNTAIPKCKSRRSFLFLWIRSCAELVEVLIFCSIYNFWHNEESFSLIKRISSKFWTVHRRFNSCVSIQVAVKSFPWNILQYSFHILVCM